MGVWKTVPPAKSAHLGSDWPIWPPAGTDTAGPSAAVNTPVTAVKQSTSPSKEGPAAVALSSSNDEDASSSTMQHRSAEGTSKLSGTSSSTDWSPTTVIEFRSVSTRAAAVRTPALEAYEEEVAAPEALTAKRISFSLKKKPVADDVRLRNKLQQKEEHIEELKAKLTELRKKLLKYETAESGGPDYGAAADAPSVGLTTTSVPTTSSTASFESRLFSLNRELPALESSIDSLRAMTETAAAGANAAQQALRSAEDNVKRLSVAYAETQSKLQELTTNQPTWTAIKRDIEQLVGNHKKELVAYTKSSLAERSWRTKIQAELDTLRQSLSDTGESAKRQLIEETEKRIRAERAVLAAEDTARKTIEINKRLRTEAADCRRQWEEQKAVMARQPNDNLDQYRARIEQLTEQNAHLSGMENTLYAWEQEATRLRSQIGALQEDSRAAQIYRAVLEARIRQLDEDQARFEAFRANALSSGQSAEWQQREAYDNLQKIQMLTQQLADQANQMETWKRWYHKSQEEKAELQKQLDAVEKRPFAVPGSSQGTAGSHAELESLRRDKAESDTRMQQLQAQLAAQTKLTEEAKERANEVQNRLMWANAELDRVGTDRDQRLDKACSDIETLKTSLQKAESAKGRLERKVHNLKNDLTDAQKQLTTAQDALKTTEQHYVDENNRAQRAEHATQQKEADLNCVRAQLAQLKADVEARDKELQARSSDAEPLKELRQQRDASQRLFVEAQQKAVNAEQTAKEAQQKAVSAEQKAHEAHQKAKESESKREELKKQLQDKTERMVTIITGKAHAEVEVDRLGKELKDAKKRLADSHSRLREMEQPLMDVAEREQRMTAMEKQLTTLQRELVAAQQRATQAERLVQESERRRMETERQGNGAEALSGPVEGLLSNRIAEYKQKLETAEANLSLEQVRVFEMQQQLQKQEEFTAQAVRRAEAAEKEAADAAERTKQAMIRRLMADDAPAQPTAESIAPGRKRPSLPTEVDDAPTGKRALARVSSTNSETPSLQHGSPDSTTQATPIGDRPTSTSQSLAKTSPKEQLQQTPTIVTVKKPRISAKRTPPTGKQSQQPGPSRQAQPPPEEDDDNYDALMEALREPDPPLKEPKQEEPIEPGVYCPPPRSGTRLLSVKVHVFEGDQDALVERFTERMRGKPLEEAQFIDYIKEYTASYEIPASIESVLHNRLVAALFSLMHRPRGTGRTSPARSANANKARATTKKRQPKREE